MKTLIALAVIALIVGAVMLQGLLIMLLVGTIHHEFSQSVSPIGFWPSVGIGVILSLIFGKTASSN